MKFVRFGEKGKEKPGLLKNGNIVDLRSIYPEIPDINETFFKEGWIEKLKSVTEPGIKMKTRTGAPVSNPSKIICLGKNYEEHAKEGGFETPGSPLLFNKTPNTLNGPFDHIVLPQSSGKIDWEVELAIIIGKQGKRIKQKNAFDYIAGYTIMNDVSGREAQFADSQWFRGKSFDTFAPMGPCMVTTDELDDIQNLDVTALVNGQIMQQANTRDMIFDIPFIIENISEDITLMPGDVISTGTPSGVGVFRDPPIELKADDVVECRIEKIGSIKNKCV